MWLPGGGVYVFGGRVGAREVAFGSTLAIKPFPLRDLVVNGVVSAQRGCAEFLAPNPADIAWLLLGTLHIFAYCGLVGNPTTELLEKK